MPLMPLYRQKNAVNATFFSVQRRQRHFFSGKTPLTPLFFRLNAVNATFFFRLHAVNSTILLVQRR